MVTSDYSAAFEKDCEDGAATEMLRGQWEIKKGILCAPCVCNYTKPRCLDKDRTQKFKLTLGEEVG